MANAAIAPYASDPAKSRGRLVAEPPSATRSDFRRDCDRIIHSAAFRRLAYKTQVFVFHEGDHFRTRLTHTLEVTQVARSIARALGLAEDLAEASALGHDLGHTPFGHAGERALDQCLALFGGFDHNAQTLRVVTSLERRYANFDGLNLTWETLEGLVKHNGPLTDSAGQPVERYREDELPRGIADYNRMHDLELWSFASVEAQAAAIADDIAYDAHDIDDGLRAGVFEISDLKNLPLIDDILRDIARDHPRLDPPRHAHELVRRVITRMIEDVIGESRRRLEALNPASVTDVRQAGKPVVGFSSNFAAADRAIKDFLYPRLYRHDRVMRIMTEAEAVVRRLFERFVDKPSDMPAEWLADLEPGDAIGRALRIADYIAGMTDRYAIGEHERLLGSTPELR
ncbi:deoxyguanosinetriphosphate triphosphohydrolase [Rhodoplanes sp. Z2-YC6860]|uniref:deoxyguanosinetriphosphate triphosphohydrolase n=1 Tax=Rhodoplanes sp. Z2-YC6860 TaxID=674703 RepID=UPI00078D6703|nr:deoxyguanosinetriphosphate triphosphohydrolase [Rhodoplanes sp. Z2-YC6860]AMN41863.1 deoxyguanosinetriphosphate triphosphohydrolase-like protein [Rhodoplanes sp. Z2-YC6860]